MEVGDEDELTALHRVILEGKFAEDPFDAVVPGSPLVADLANRVVDELSSRQPGWQEWRQFESQDPRFMRVVRARLAEVRNGSSWSRWSRTQRLDYLRILVSPFVASDATLNGLLADDPETPTPTWQAATATEVAAIIAEDLARCSKAIRRFWKECRVKPHSVSITRHGRDESVFVVAKHAGDVMYWEDIDEGFNTSPLDADGRIIEHRCNQDDLCMALTRWHDGVEGVHVGPARPVSD